MTYEKWTDVTNYAAQVGVGLRRDMAWSIDCAGLRIDLDRRGDGWYVSTRPSLFEEAEVRLGAEDSAEARVEALWLLLWRLKDIERHAREVLPRAIQVASPWLRDL